MSRLKFDRRAFLQVSAAMGFNGFQNALAQEPGVRNVPAAERRPARRTQLPVVFLYNSGGPSPKETFCPDEATVAAELRGELGSIATTISGVRFCELWPRMARLTGSYSLLRGLDSGSSDHFQSARNMLRPEGAETFGVRWGEQAADGGVPYMFVQCPSFYTVMDAMDHTRSMHIEWRCDHTLEPGKPLWERSLTGPGDYASPNIRPDPKMAERVPLLRAFDSDFPVRTPSTERRDRNLDLAISLATGGGRFFEAFNPPPAERRQHARDLERYGAQSRVGRGLLLARRLAERGAGVSICYNELGMGWDMHSDLFNRSRVLAAETDRAAAAFIEDMNDGRFQGVFVMMGEFSRTPRVNNSAGRDHWSQAFPGIFAGGKFKKGVVHGRVNPQGEVRDGRVPVQLLGPTIINAAGGEIPPAQARVREILDA